MATKSDEVAGLNMSLDDIIKKREEERRGGRGRTGRGRGRGGAGRGAGRGHARRETQGPQLQLSFTWSKEGEEEVFSASYEAQRIVEIKSNGDVLLSSGGSSDAETLATLNYVCQQIRLKIVKSDAGEGEWVVQQADGRWQQKFEDEMKCNAFPRRAWNSIKATLEALPNVFHPNEENDYATSHDEQAQFEGQQGARKRKPQGPLPAMPLLPFPPPFPFMPLPGAMLMQPGQLPQQHASRAPLGNRGRGRGARGGDRSVRRGGRRGDSDFRGGPSKRARQHRQF